MNEKISALMDGELIREDASRVIKSLGADAAGRDQWDCYHLIGATLRNEANPSTLARRQAIFDRLAAEPTVLAPNAMARLVSEKRTRMALAAAASIVTISAVAVVALRTQSGAQVAPVALVQKAPPAVLVESVTGKSKTGAEGQRVNDYLVMHRQFSNPSAFQQATLVQPRAAGER
ncbi:MAG: sigma-E factor negative regulatory protein [Betaproteobacteria bacterium]|nr:sigma-E factor negative regulatory protein [Betaproteobacteria bacterium]